MHFSTPHWIITSSILLIGTVAPIWADSTSLTGTVRDFKYAGTPGGHPDFENALGADFGIVGPIGASLGADGKPVYDTVGSHPTTHGKTFFDQWYRDTPGVNASQSYTITLDKDPGTGVFTYSNPAFYPIDNQLLGNQGAPHNYSFTYELNTVFNYKGGETFTFSGDDDVWVYVNKKLAIDLGGVHTTGTQSISLDALANNYGLTSGNNYDLDVFFAERHTTQSTFRIDTTLALTPASVPEPSGPVILGFGMLMLSGLALRHRKA